MTYDKDSYRMHTNSEDSINTTAADAGFKKPQPRKWYCCYLRRKYLLLLIMALVIVVVVILSLLVSYSQRIQQITTTLAHSTGDSSARRGVSGKQTGEERFSSDGCELSKGRRSFPDLDYALFGYNILRGYPLAVGHDPGLTHPIFRHNYNEGMHTADCRYHVPKGYIYFAMAFSITVEMINIRLRERNTKILKLYKQIDP